jgi:hypothetical protein
MSAFAVLLRRVVYDLNPSVFSQIAKCFRQPSGSIRRDGGVERAVEAVARIHQSHSILILIDSDDDCPKDLGPELEQRARRARPDLHIAVILAHREYETWFVAAAESLAGKRGLRVDLSAPDDPESIRDAKGWLRENSVGQVRYRPTQDQAALSHSFDLHLAYERSRSFRKLRSAIEALVLTATPSD